MAMGCPLIGGLGGQVRPEVIDEVTCRWVVGRIAGMMAVKNPPIGIDNKYAGELTDIAAGDADAMPIEHGRQTLPDHAQGKQGFRGGLLELKATEEGFVRIRNYGKWHTELGFEGGRCLQGPQPHENHSDAKVLKFLFSAAQLRHLIPTERSPIVPHEHEHQGLIFPQITEAGMPPVRHENMLVL